MTTLATLHPPHASATTDAAVAALVQTLEAADTVEDGLAAVAAVVHACDAATDAGLLRQPLVDALLQLLVPADHDETWEETVFLVAIETLTQLLALRRRHCGTPVAAPIAMAVDNLCWPYHNPDGNVDDDRHRLHVSAIHTLLYEATRVPMVSLSATSVLTLLEDGVENRGCQPCECLIESEEPRQLWDVVTALLAADATATCLGVWTMPMLLLRMLYRDAAWLADAAPILRALVSRRPAAPNDASLADDDSSRVLFDATATVLHCVDSAVAVAAVLEVAVDVASRRFDRGALHLLFALPTAVAMHGWHAGVVRPAAVYYRHVASFLTQPYRGWGSGSGRSGSANSDDDDDDDRRFGDADPDDAFAPHGSAGGEHPYFVVQREAVAMLSVVALHRDADDVVVPALGLALAMANSDDVCQSLSNALPALGAIVHHYTLPFSATSSATASATSSARLTFSSSLYSSHPSPHSRGRPIRLRKLRRHPQQLHSRARRPAPRRTPYYAPQRGRTTRPSAAYPAYDVPIRPRLAPTPAASALPPITFGSKLSAKER